eukprot:NODE_1518_length_586_cov_8.329609_g1218_i0.p1 GENE.NODE_1518_length_586_cov_8.329609_g1218_i0~~NODE_1518_length_586_cov_8.329609_g1218_i0.p1  ORF type:complete len:143 (+),score=27.66 NODE_1518_length_586_cov_8.329609_g1218_i0:77-505(+)
MDPDHSRTLAAHAMIGLVDGVRVEDGKLFVPASARHMLPMGRVCWGSATERDKRKAACTKASRQHRVAPVPGNPRTNGSIASALEMRVKLPSAPHPTDVPDEVYNDFVRGVLTPKAGLGTDWSQLTQHNAKWAQRLQAACDE